MNISGSSIKKVIALTIVGFLLADSVVAQAVSFEGLDVSLDPVEARSGWRSHNTITLDTEEYKRGTASLRSVGSGKDQFRKTFSTPVDVSNMRYLTFWYYVSDPKKLGGSDKGQIEIGSAGTYDTEEQNWSVHEQHFHKGWNYVVLDLPGRHRSKTSARTNLTQIDWFRIYHHPTGTITTRIDEIRFTNRDPHSLAFSQLLEAKRLSRDFMQANYLDSLHTLLYETNSNDPERRRICRRLQIEHAHWQVSRYSLEKIGINSSVAGNDVLGKKRLMDLVCGIGSVQPDVAIQSLQQAKGYEVTLNRAIMDLYDVSQESAAEVRNRILELDLSRIMGTCGATAEEIDGFISSGIIPGGLVGTNVLFRNCDGSANEIALRLGSRDALIDNRVASFRQCMKDFTDQSSQCSNPYANSTDEFNNKVDKLPGYSQEQKREMKETMANYLMKVDSIELDSQMRDGTFYWEVVPYTEADLDHPEYPEIQNLHSDYDNRQARIWEVEHQQEHVRFRVDSGLEEHRYAGAETVLERLHAKEQELIQERESIRQQICEKDPDDEVCVYGPPPPPEPTPEPLPPDLVARCAEMNIGDGYSAFYNKSPGDSGFSRQLNEGDRIDHCLCELFDKSYAGIPQFELAAGVGVSSFCPDPMERLKHECTQPGWDDGPPSPECVMQGLVSDRINEEDLPNRICWAMRTEECPNPTLDDNGDCSCFKKPSGQVDLSPLYERCANALRCADGSAPTYIDDLRGCGCAPLDPVGNVCMDNILIRNDPVINYFPGVSALADRPVVSLPKNESLVTRAVSRSELSGNQLNFSVFNAFDTAPVAGQAEARCTNLNSGVSNYLIDRVAVTNLRSGTARDVGFSFSDTDMEQCFGEDGQSRAYLELGVRTGSDIPRVGYVANGGLGDILGPVLPTQPCVPIITGPRPTPWNLSGGQVIRTDIPTAYPTIFADGAILLPHTIIEPVVFTRDYAPSSLNLYDDPSRAAVSTLDVTRQGPVGVLTLHLHLRGNWLAGRFLVTLTAPDGTEVYEVFGLGTSENGEPEEVYDGGIILNLDELDYTIDSEGPWTLEVLDVGGSESGRKSGDLYSWSLNFNAVEAWSETP